MDDPARVQRGQRAYQGYGYGLWVGILAALQVPYTPVRPAVWKKAFSLGKDKEQSRLRAQQLFPGADLRLRKHHGKLRQHMVYVYASLSRLDFQGLLENSSLFFKALQAFPPQKSQPP